MKSIDFLLDLVHAKYAHFCSDLLKKFLSLTHSLTLANGKLKFSKSCEILQRERKRKKIRERAAGRDKGGERGEKAVFHLHRNRKILMNILIKMIN